MNVVQEVDAVEAEDGAALVDVVRDQLTQVRLGRRKEFGESANLKKRIKFCLLERNEC
jgi:hypothetical protein